MNYFVDYCEIEMVWLVYLDTGEWYGLPICTCTEKSQALFVRDALLSFGESYWR